jgi:hypothetical protein
LLLDGKTEARDEDGGEIVDSECPVTQASEEPAWLRDAWENVRENLREKMLRRDASWTLVSASADSVD